MLDSLERLGGAAARSHVRIEPDQRMMRIVCTWPGDFDIRRPLDLGFAVDRDVDAIVGQYMTDQGITASSYRPGSAPGRPQ